MLQYNNVKWKILIQIWFTSNIYSGKKKLNTKYKTIMQYERREIEFETYGFESSIMITENFFD